VGRACAASSLNRSKINHLDAAPLHASRIAPNGSARALMTTQSGSSPRVSGVALRYAEALFDLAIEYSALDTVAKDLAGLKKLIAISADFRSFLSSPVYDAEEKARSIDAVAAQAGVAPLTRNFLGVIAHNRRLFALDQIIEAFRQRLAVHRGEVTAEAIAAAPLSDDQARRLRGEIEGLVGKAVNLDLKVDPDLLGGMVVKVGSQMFDSSLRTKLNRLKSVMKEA
jgi:F-type H+-transporting ATPase subunit delta